MARPASGKYDCDTMCQKINEYTDLCMKKKVVPILKECTVKCGWCYDRVMLLRGKEEYAELDSCINRLICVKEYMLERLALNGRVDKTMAIFSLKQLGWKDQQVVDVGEGTVNALKIVLKVAE